MEAVPRVAEAAPGAVVMRDPAYPVAVDLVAAENGRDTRHLILPDRVEVQDLVGAMAVQTVAPEEDCRMKMMVANPFIPEQEIVRCNGLWELVCGQQTVLL